MIERNEPIQRVFKMIELIIMEDGTRKELEKVSQRGFILNREGKTSCQRLLSKSRRYFKKSDELVGGLSGASPFHCAECQYTTQCILGFQFNGGRNCSRFSVNVGIKKIPSL